MESQPGGGSGEEVEAGAGVAKLLLGAVVEIVVSNAAGTFRSWLMRGNAVRGRQLWSTLMVKRA